MGPYRNGPQNESPRCGTEVASGLPVTIRRILWILSLLGLAAALRPSTPRLTVEPMAARTVVVCAAPALPQAPQGRVRGVVVDEAGAAVAGARIELLGQTRSAVTGADGRFEFSGVGVYAVRVSHPRYLPLADTALSAAADVERTFVLSRGLEAAGRIVDSSGAPLTARVRFVQYSTGDRETTAVGGDYVLGGLAAAPVQLFVSAPGYATQRVTSRPGSIPQIVLTRPARIRGTAAGASVAVTVGRDRYRVPGGRFELKLPASGEVTLELQDDKGRLLATQRVTVAEGDELDDVTLRP